MWTRRPVVNIARGTGRIRFLNLFFFFGLARYYSFQFFWAKRPGKRFPKRRDIAAGYLSRVREVFSSRPPFLDHTHTPQRDKTLYNNVQSYTLTHVSKNKDRNKNKNINLDRFRARPSLAPGNFLPLRSRSCVPRTKIHSIPYNNNTTLSRNGVSAGN